MGLGTGEKRLLNFCFKQGEGAHVSHPVVSPRHVGQGDVGWQAFQPLPGPAGWESPSWEAQEENPHPWGGRAPPPALPASLVRTPVCSPQLGLGPGLLWSHLGLLSSVIALGFVVFL